MLVKARNSHFYLNHDRTNQGAKLKFDVGRDVVYENDLLNLIGYGVVGDLNKIVPALTEAIRAQKAE